MTPIKPAKAAKVAKVTMAGKGTHKTKTASLTAKTAKPGKASTATEPDKWQLRLYVTDQTSRSLRAFENLKEFCETHLKGRYRIKVIDLLKHPKLAKGDQILAVPTVVRALPKPVRTLIGTLSDTERVLVGLDLRAAGKPG